MAIYDYLKPANYDYVDLFAGAGGWSLAAQRLGLAGIGLELDKSACATRKAVGFDTYEGDLRGRLAYHNTEQGLIASPPCQTFSMAGKGAGRAEMDKVLDAIARWSWTADFADERTGLVLEPLRWILARASSERPYQWIAMEQVPTCLPIWEAYANLLGEIGYYATAGILQSEQYGVPQTRKRAVLMAHRDRPVYRPEPTHSRYYPHDPKKLDPDVLKWVSMAEALGWTDDAEVVSNYSTGGDTANPGRRSGDDPSATVTSHINRNKIFFFNNQANSAGRTDDQPAPTIAAGHLRGRAYVSDNRPNTAVRGIDFPAPTVLGNGEKGTHASWQYRANSMPRSAVREMEQPAPTVMFGKDTKSGMWVGPEREPIRVTPQEAGVLQSFPAHFPWQGTKTAQYQQVGNAIPPLMAQAILEALVDV